MFELEKIKLNDKSSLKDFNTHAARAARAIQLLAF